VPYPGKLLIFDLDETLIHTRECGEDQMEGQLIDIKTKEGEVLKAYVNVRPFTRECLTQVSSRF